MKLEKREITLNEMDSIKDLLVIERALLSEYTHALKKAERIENRNYIHTEIQNTAKEVCLLSDILKTLQEDAV